MARIPYSDTHEPEARRLVERIVAERGSVLHLYQMLLHSPPIAEGWLSLLTAVRQKALLAGDLRELVIIRVAILNGASYEADQHAPIAKLQGITDEQLSELGKWQSSRLFNSEQRAALALTDDMTRQVQVDELTFAEVRSCFDDRILVELVTTIAAYNMVSRFLEALRIHSGDERMPT